jgi:hypothetical protein
MYTCTLHSTKCSLATHHIINLNISQRYGRIDWSITPLMVIDSSITQLSDNCATIHSTNIEHGRVITQNTVKPDRPCQWPAFHVWHYANAILPTVHHA